MSEEPIPFDIGPDSHPSGVPFKNLIPRSAPDPIAMAVMSDAADGEEYLSLLVRFGVFTEAEAEEIRAEVDSGERP